MGQSRPRILVVDDVEDNVFTLERRLKQFLDPEITSAANGEVALEKLRSAPLDLVLLDVQMPKMDGVAALEQMKSDMSLREVPVIMVSAVDDFDTVLRCIKLGADDYVQKPFNADLLRARVESALERKRLRDQEGLFVEQLREEKARVNELLHSLLPKRPQGLGAGRRKTPRNQAGDRRPRAQARRGAAPDVGRSDGIPLCEGGSCCAGADHSEIARSSRGLRARERIEQTSDGLLPEVPSPGRWMR
jgi:CheY-like chemotaxis protein